MLPNISGEFRAGDEPSLRFTPSGMAVCSLRAVASKRKKNENDEWVDDKTCWVNVIGFKKVAENMAESIAKGDLIVVTGQLQTDTWEDSEGNKRLSVEVVANAIGPAITFNAAKTTRSARSSGSSSGGSSGEDPWATSGGTDEPPF